MASYLHGIGALLLFFGLELALGLLFGQLHGHKVARGAGLDDVVGALRVRLERDLGQTPRTLYKQNSIRRWLQQKKNSATTETSRKNERIQVEINQPQLTWP